MADHLAEVTLRMSSKLLARITRLADEAYQSPDTFIESALAHLVRDVSAARRQLRSLPRDEPPSPGQYL